MSTINEILNLNASYQINTWSEISNEPTIQTILQEIKSEKHKAPISTLRKKLEEGNKEYYDNYKKHLPAVTFSATFDVKRTNEKLKFYNSIIVIDIDKLESEQIIETYNYLLNDEHVISFWKSPSNKGFKGLVCIEYSIEKNDADLYKLHKSAFKKLSEYFLDKYNIELDQSGSDITRLCFLSYDTELILKSNLIKFNITDEDLIISTKLKSNPKSDLNYLTTKDKLFNPHEKNDQYDRKIMSDIIRHLKNKKLSITYSYDEWCKVGMAIANSFTYEIGIKYFLKLSSLDGDKYNETNSTNFLNNCYETKKGDINFNSIVYLANQKGYQTKNQRNAVPKAED
ncbi:hypothetical protein EYY60_21070 [Flavobacterium zhairuonense]|uniref:BT4734/BF3469 family protein n=1 Tax=Flavobacterium zhairuonense TaxID=2493631 RepID=UPI0010514606|nr:BT4734/BF3469 family protein [Flavobacterium zhairuonense]KAF2507003.1 hypothetical protein EYY60_21070 [Flavobacterium zhairuonense]